MVSESNTQKAKKLFPTIVIGLGCIWALGSDFSFTWRHYVAFICVIALVVAFMAYRPAYKYVLSATFLLGFLNLLCFIPGESSGFFRIGSLKLGFQPISMLLILIVYIMHFSRANDLIIGAATYAFGSSAEEAEAVEIEKHRNEVDKFKKRYSPFTTEQLEFIIAENRYVPEALEAARKLLEEREKELR